MSNFQGPRPEMAGGGSLLLKREKISGHGIRLLNSWIPASAGMTKKEPCLSNVRHSGEPRIESGAGVGVQVEVFKRKGPPANDV
jgi:hypothetical protein